MNKARKHALGRQTDGGAFNLFEQQLLACAVVGDVPVSNFTS
ncbi:MAG TPA: hypothetical protein VFI95_13405 [Terriglobales bacterium]|nr:hypothetical protein [Terriglobales bacterium]